MLFKSRRGAMVGIPMLMGLLPTPGGIMLSAPMVRDLADSIGVTRSRSAAINFFFRHQWEMVWPLFPSIPLIQGMLGISAIALIKHNIVISICGITGGIIFCCCRASLPKKSSETRQNGSTACMFSFRRLADRACSRPSCGIECQSCNRHPDFNNTVYAGVSHSAGTMRAFISAGF